MDPDAQELIESIERVFHIQFKPDELTDDSTLADLCAALQSRFTGAKADACFTSIAFWRIRRAINLPKRSIAPSTPLDAVLPAKGRRRAWFAISEAAGLQLPGLEHSSAFAGFLLLLSAIIAFLIPHALGGGWWMLLSMVLLPLIPMPLFYASSRFARSLPENVQTFGDLARTAAGLNYGILAAEFGRSRDTELVEAVHHVVADLIGIAPRDLKEQNPTLLDLVLCNDGFRAAE